MYEFKFQVGQRVKDVDINDVCFVQQRLYDADTLKAYYLVTRKSGNIAVLSKEFLDNNFEVF